jgi:hypothetical protein
MDPIEFGEFEFRRLLPLEILLWGVGSGGAGACGVHAREFTIFPKSRKRIRPTTHGLG